MQTATATVTLGSGPAAARPELVSARIERSVDVPVDTATVVLPAGQPPALGDPLEVALGSDGSAELVFSGTVARVRTHLDHVVVSGLGGLLPLVRLRIAATYADRPVSAIATDLAAQAGLSVGSLADTPVLPAFTVDARSGAEAQLRRLGQRLGVCLYASKAGALMFHDPAGGSSPLGALAGAAADLTGGGAAIGFGRNLLTARVTTTSPRYGGVHVGAESPASSRGDTASHWLTADDSSFDATAGDADPQHLLLDPVARTADLARRFATGWESSSGAAGRQAEVELPGQPGLDLGDAVGVDDLPSVFPETSGFVRGLRHRFDPDCGFVTRLLVQLGSAR